MEVKYKLPEKTLRQIASEIAFNATISLDMLIQVSMKACDHFKDGDAARIQMIKDCEDLPPQYRGDLYKHFVEIYEK